MYDLPYFKENDPAVVRAFMREHPFAFLTGVNHDSKPVATQVPMFVDERDDRIFLSGHIMRNTDHHKAFAQNNQVLAVFTGPHTYVSASWYDNKQQGSTWNYCSVHARGELRFLEEAALKKVLQRTTDHFENNPHSGANFHDLPAEYVDRLVKAIVAFEIEVTELSHVFKLSQNRDQKSYDNIIDKLKQGSADAREIGISMENRRSKLFGS